MAARGIVLMNPLDWINRGLVSEPLNWGIVFLMATIWLLAFHFVMTGFTAMQGSANAVPAAPGSGQAIPPSDMMPALSGTGNTGIWTDDTAESSYGFAS